MRRTLVAVLSAATVVAAFGVGGCADDRPASAPPTVRPISGASITPGASKPSLPTVAPLPPADQLAGVLYRLADTSVPADQKVGLVQYATADDEPALKNFGEALADNGFTR